MNIFASILMVNNSGGSSGGGGSPTDFLTNWNRRKGFTVNGSEVTESIIEFTVYNTSGTDTTTEVYLDGNVRADWGDLRFTSGDGVTVLPYAILRREATNVLVAVNLGVVQSADFYIYYDGPAASVFRIGHVTDIHFDPNEPSVDKRDQGLVMTASFNTRMETYLPHLVAGGGDWMGSVTTGAPRLTMLQDTVDELYLAASGPSTPEVMWVAMGNHDFDQNTFGEARTILQQTDWMVTNTLYGAKEVGAYLIVSLDANYAPDTQTHKSNNHQGYGYVNTDQLTWFEGVLSAATKPVIVFCHQPLSEMDTDQFTLTKEVYHTQNRAAVRAIIEASNKVVCCIHGHVHYSRNDVINGIPYITSTNIGNTGQFGEQPATNTGKWALLDFDSSSQTIRVRTEAIVGGDVELIYDQFLPFGRTQFFSDVSNNHEEVYALGNDATYEKSSFYRDPTQSYVSNDAHLYKYPVNLNIPDIFLSDNTIKIVGRTDTPNFGRDQWYFSPRTGKFVHEFRARLTTVKTKQFKYGDSNIVASPAFRIHFNNDGNISAHNGATLTNVRTYTTDTWYKFRVVADAVAQTFSLEIDDVIEATDFAFTNPITSIDRRQIVTETGTLYLDSYGIKPYNDTEITSFQPEEIQ
jgi:hypothetical protein